MGCKDAILLKPLLKNCTINYLTFGENTGQPFNDNLCLFLALALQLRGNQRVEEETSKIFNLFINKMDGLSTDQFQGVHMNKYPFVEDLLTLNILLYDIDIANGNIIGELDEVCRKTKILCDCWDTATTYDTWTSLMQSFNIFAALIVTLFQQNIQFGATFNYMQWTSEKLLSSERISHPRNSLWQAGLFRYQVDEWTKTLQNLAKLDF